MRMDRKVDKVDVFVIGFGIGTVVALIVLLISPCWEIVPLDCWQPEPQGNLTGEIEIHITATLQENWKETNLTTISRFCCHKNGKCDNCQTDKGVLWLWGLHENITGAIVNVEILKEVSP